MVNLRGVHFNRPEGVERERLMARRQREWAARARLQLVNQLGGMCVDCGSQSDLVVDHIYARTWSLRSVEQSRRVARYRREAVLGLLTVRCLVCNSRKGSPRQRELAVRGGV